MVIFPLTYVVSFILYIFFQVYLLNELTLFGIATPHIFLIFLFMLPVEAPLMLTYILAFAMGMMVDFLSDTYLNGLHAASALLAIGLRPLVLRMITINFKNRNDVSIFNQDYLWYVAYFLIMLFIHHTAYYFLEAFTFNNFFYTLLRIISSVLYSFIGIYILCILFYKNK